MASDMGVPFLGKLPLDPRIGKCCDEGKSFLTEVPDSPAAKAYAALIQGEKGRGLREREGVERKGRMISWGES